MIDNSAEAPHEVQVLPLASSLNGMLYAPFEQGTIYGGIRTHDTGIFRSPAITS